MGMIHKIYRNIKAPICLICKKEIRKYKNKKGYLIGGKQWLGRKVHGGKCNIKYDRIRNLGKKLTEEHKRKVGLVGIGRKFSLESRLKKSKAISGKNHYNWKGGITEENHKIRRSLQYRLWRTAVYERDNYCCVLCGKKSEGDIQADHIKPFSKFPELRFSIDNGRTLCIKCHKATDTYGNKKRKDIYTVLGANGFIGKHLVRFLKSKGHYVRAVTSPRLREIILEADESFVADGMDYEQILLATKNTTYLFGFMANMGGIGYFSQANYYPPIHNYTMDLNMLRACEENGVKRLFYPSSACAYPLYLMAKGKHLTEEMLNCYAAPDQMYGWEKLTMTKLMRKSPIDCRVGVLHTIYGEGQEYEGEKAKFPPQVAYNALQSKKTGVLSVWGDGTQTRTFLHIQDAIEKIYEVMMSNLYHGEVNIGSDKEVSISEVVKLCLKIIGISPKVKHDLKKPVGPKKRRCSNQKFNQFYTYRDKVSLEEGFTRLIRYIEKHDK